MMYFSYESIPTLREIVFQIYKACIPDLEEPSIKGYFFKLNKKLELDCSKISTDLSEGTYFLKSKFNTSRGLTEASTVNEMNEDKVWCLIEQMIRYDIPTELKLGQYYPETWKTIKKRKDRKEKPSNWESIALNPFTSWDSKFVENWANGTTKKINDQTLYRATGYYSLAVLQFADYKTFLCYFFEKFKFVDDINTIYDSSLLLGWNEDLILLITYILLGCSRGENWTKEKLIILEQFISKKMEPVHAAILAEKSWLADVIKFRPRSMDRVQDLSMQDFYVRPDFEFQKGSREAPLRIISKATTSIRSLIVAQTGMGKSMYVRMSSLCFCRELLDNDLQIEHLSAANELTNNIYVIYIPAYMFSYCYQNQEYRSWTDDFAKLYFNCMFRLSMAINFDKHDKRQIRIDSECANYIIDDELEYSPLGEYILALARKGRLILIADSFDEIVSGDMRMAYINSLVKFRKHYCDFPEAVGAHILLTSREMSQDTMNSLKSALESTNIYKIMPLSPDKQEELIKKWDRAFPGEGIQDNIKQLDNHFFVELCKNPYMLSVVCGKHGNKINNVTDKLITDVMSLRTSMNVDSLESDVLRSVLQPKKLKEIMQNLALETIKQQISHFPKNLLVEYFIPELKGYDLSENEVKYCCETLVSFFTTSVGLIVPADYEDDHFQFISDQIKYELASSKLFQEAPIFQMQNCLSVLSGMKNDIEYLALIVPLICKATNSPLISEKLIQNLVLREFESDNLKLVSRALLDLILQRYGNNITHEHTEVSGTPLYDCIVHSDRLIMMRLLSLPSLSLTEVEKKGVLQSNAYRVCSGFLSEYQISLLQPSIPPCE